MMSVSASEREAFFDTLKKMKNELDDKTEAIVALLDELDEASLSICSQGIRARPEKKTQQYRAEQSKLTESDRFIASRLYCFIFFDKYLL